MAQFNKGAIAWNRKHPKTSKEHDEIIDEIAKGLESKGSRVIILGYKPERKNELVFPDIIEIQGKDVKIICHEIEKEAHPESYFLKIKFNHAKHFWDSIQWYLFSRYNKKARESQKKWIFKKIKKANLKSFISETNSQRDSSGSHIYPNDVAAAANTLSKNQSFKNVKKEGTT